jgi:hypothetical protein
LRWYPRSWRKANEDVMVGTLLDVADGEGRDAPSRAELHDLRRSGLATRADRVLPSSIRDRVAAISLGAGTALALAAGSGQLWGAWDAQGSPAEPVPDGFVWQIVIQPLLWVLGAVAAVVGWTVVARILLVLTLPASLVAVFSVDVSFVLRPSFFALVMMGVLALLACTGRSQPRWQLAATGIMGVLLTSWLAFLGPFAGTYFPRGGLVDFIVTPYPLAAMVVATAVFMIRRDRVAAGAVIVAASPWVVLILGHLLISTGTGPSGVGYIASAFLDAALLLWIPVAMVLLVRRYARAPWHSPSESSDSPTSASRPSSTR